MNNLPNLCNLYYLSSKQLPAQLLTTDCIKLSTIKVVKNSYKDKTAISGKVISDVLTIGTIGLTPENVRFINDPTTNCKNLTIYGTGEMNHIEAATNQQWYSFGQSIEKILIEEGVTSIGNHAFDSIGNLIEVTLTTTMKSIGQYAFSECIKLKTML